MRRIRYMVATSLDGYIAGPNGEADWIIMDQEIEARLKPHERKAPPPSDDVPF